MCESCTSYDELLTRPVSKGEPRAHPGGKPFWYRSLMSGETLSLLAIGSLVVNAASHSLLFSGSLAASAILALACLSRQKLSLIKLLLVPSYMTIIVAGSQLFFTGHTPLFTLGPLTAYQEGLARAGTLGAKIIAGSAILLLYGLIIRSRYIYVYGQVIPAGFSWWSVLAARLRVPPVLLETGQLIYRYLFLLAEEAERIKQAQACRLGYQGRWTGLRDFGALIGMVVIRSFERAECVQEAAQLRGADSSGSAARLAVRSNPACFAIALPVVFVLAWAGQML